MAFIDGVGVYTAIGIFIIIFLILLFFSADANLTLVFCYMFSPPKDYRDQVVWITGASSGIGEYLAYSFAKRHARLVLSGVNVERLEKVRSKCVDIGRLCEDDVIALPFSIENFDEHEECIDTIVDQFQYIDILVNNAGCSQRAEFQDIDIEVDQRLFNVNVFGTVNLTRKVLKRFLARGEGHIVVTSSLAGKIGAPYSSAYTGSKHALHGYFECLRTEVIQKNIDVTIVCPGPVHSQLTDRCVTGTVGERYDHTQLPTDRKMSTERCAELMLTAISNKLDECWIAQQPMLSLFYLGQYLPTFFRTVILKRLFSRNLANRLRQGR